MDFETVNQELTDVRERLVRIETNLEHIQRSVDRDKGSTSGSVIIPVGVAVAVVEVIKILVERVA